MWHLCDKHMNPSGSGVRKLNFLVLGLEIQVNNTVPQSPFNSPLAQQQSNALMQQPKGDAPDVAFVL